MTISVRLSDKDAELIKAYKKAMEEYRKNPKTYTMQEVKEELGL